MTLTMSPSSLRQPPTPAAANALVQLLAMFGGRVREQRLRRRRTVRELADQAHLSPATVLAIEDGHAGSLDAYVRLATALGLRLEAGLLDGRARPDTRPSLTADVVHSAMGEYEAAHFRPLGFTIGVDEPYQHYQFAGRADVVVWDTPGRALLHIENRTRFPDLQESAGAFNAKRAYLGAALAARLGERRWESETHVIAALWSAEVLHVLRRRPETFRALGPDPTPAFGAWWAGMPPAAGTSTLLVFLDPAATRRQRAWVGLDDALKAKPRHRGYAEVAATLGKR